jgi:iron complex transport system substrate-binding protein
MARRLNWVWSGLLLVSLLIAACAPVQSPVAQPSATTANENKAETAYPVTIENCGNTLTVEKRPERVIVSWGGQAAYLLGLGLEEELIGIYYRSPDDENRLVPPALRDRFLAIPNLGQDGVPPGKEIPISLKADFFYSDNPGDFADGRATPEDFAASGATVFSSVYGCTDPAQQTLEQMFEEIQNLGRIFAEEAAAQALVNEIRAGVEAVQVRVAGREPVRTLLVEGSAETLYAAGNGLVTDVFARAGGTNIFDGASYDAPPSREALAASNPDVVLIWDYNADELEPVVRTVFANSPAVANNRIVRIPYIGGVGMRVAELAEALGRAFHPDAFATVAPETAYPVTVESCGRTLTFTQAPTRVFVDYQTQLELLLRLDLGAQIVAYSGFGEVPLAPDVMAAYSQLQATKLDAFPTKEQAVSAGYDLAIIAFPGYVYDASRGRASREEWEQAGTVLYESNADCADGGADRTLEDSFQQIRDLGQIFNVPERAAALLAEMSATLTQVEEQVAGRPTPKAAILDYIDENGVPSFYAAGIYTDLIARAGGENVFADQSEQYATISPEVVATRPVDLLFVMEWAGGGTAEEKAEYYFKTFPNAPASQNRRFVILTNMELNAGSGNALAIEKMARGLHPEAFE